MRAVICTKYGPPEVLQLAEVEQPTPKDDEVRIKIFATAVTASDGIVRGFKLPIWHPLGLLMGLVVGFGKPRNPILGMVLAGEVEATGQDVAQFKVGDPVFASTGTRFGCYAEYICLPEKSKKGLPAQIPSVMTLKPTNMTYEEAAALPYGGLLALLFLRKGNIQSGQNVLIYGASGAIGTAAVQIARAFGNTVTGVCSTRNIEMVQSLGANRVIDYTAEDATSKLERYDLVLDAVGKRKSSALKKRCKEALTPQGQYVSVDDGNPKPTLELLTTIKDLVEAGKIKPIIDRTYPLEQMAEAHRYVDTGHKKGNVVITVAHNDAP
ncbi:MAG: NAD(P)-dependent alcohol dehydrogenase [Chloroflexi bacterium]|nr:NAD(P)-dependent alcohol dehydrogenase [Chloroflexota bacterium]